MYFKLVISAAIIISWTTLTSAFNFGTFSTRKKSLTFLHAKKILLAFDGTGDNARDYQPDKKNDKSFTNVLSLHLLAGGYINGGLNESEVEGQISLYERGIGAISNHKGTRLLRQVGGDLSRQTKPMRKKLEKVYEPGDKLYMIGFSRGSSAARKFAMELYQDGLMTKYGEKIEEPPIEFLGCFETVAMQVKKRAVWILRTMLRRSITPSTVLGETGKVAPNVKKAVHNVALDDNRQWSPLPCYPPVLMGAEERVHEAWFPGEHGDVGGSWYTKGIPDCSCVYMKEWMESVGLKFLQAVDIKEECLKIPDNLDIKITPADLTLKPDPSDRIHLNEKCQVKTDSFTPSYRPVHVLKNDKKVKGAIVNVHETVLLHMEAKKKEGIPYPVNPNLKDANFVVVGSFGKVLDDKTKRLQALLQSDY